MADITFHGRPVKTVGQLPEIGSKAPDFRLTRTTLQDVRLSDLAGKKVIMNIFPSIETPVCAESVRRFNTAADTLKNTIVLCVSRDLPFAHERFNMAEGLQTVWSVSELRDFNFGEAYGLRIVEGPLAGLLSRVVIVLDENGRILYTQQVPDIGQEPDYAPALQVAQTAGADTPILEACTKTFTGEHHRLEDDDEWCDDGRSGKI